MQQTGLETGHQFNPLSLHLCLSLSFFSLLFSLLFLCQLMQIYFARSLQHLHVAILISFAGKKMIPLPFVICLFSPDFPRLACAFFIGSGLGKNVCWNCVKHAI